MGDWNIHEIFNQIPEINFNSGYRYFLGNMDNYALALMSSLKSIRAKLSILQTMCHTMEFEGLRTITQTLQRMMSNIGAIEIADYSYQLETALLNGNSTNVEELLTEYIDCLKEFSMRLEQLLKELNIEKVRKKQEEEISYLKYDFTKTKESIRLSSDLLERKII